jgi:hypothetical protein
MNIRVLPFLIGFLLSACSDEQPPVHEPEQALIEEPVEIVLPAAVEQPEAELPLPEKVKQQQPHPSISTEQEAPALDLHVPRSLLDELRFDDPPLQEQSQPLLPPLFVEKPKPERSFNIEGSLFTHENLNDGVPVLKSIDGAELQLEYKH